MKQSKIESINCRKPMKSPGIDSTRNQHPEIQWTLVIRREALYTTDDLIIGGSSLNKDIEKQDKNRREPFWSSPHRENSDEKENSRIV